MKKKENGSFDRNSCTYRRTKKTLIKKDDCLITIEAQFERRKHYGQKTVLKSVLSIKIIEYIVYILFSILTLIDINTDFCVLVILF